ncbi:ClbS/DfsB family four-helix bundle protein [Chondrinema litorale]|uniref:ClbS/DfsB family four-helix bundle protein n=1 Tax=Chondrinema litorale TaxID=2994555 RepID=UPI0025431A8A|nr:ClbS/DfsB family four-helix bundle protein [Chondrinema litorale]UZR97489.1 ClbS/DfsB family four-helix bundle protein [Chondrinema litorale]
MPRPKNKEELLQIGIENAKNLNDLIDSIPESERDKEFSKGTLNRNIRDVMAHLYHWHLMMLNWYKIGMAGKKPEMPAPGYTWKTVPELNTAINKKYSTTHLSDIRKLFNESHKVLIKLIESHTNEELFEKKKYKWTGSTFLGSYLISATSSHYDWAYKLIKKRLK